MKIQGISYNDVSLYDENIFKGGRVKMQGANLIIECLIKET
ncbi:MAG: hypothetical protein ACLR3X_04100 [Intestinibacter bartlettii]